MFAGLPVAKEAGPEFSNFFIRSYLEGLAELEGKTLSSVTIEDVEMYHKWTDVCTLVGSRECLTLLKKCMASLTDL